jgi:hypothetical protein
VLIGVAAGLGVTAATAHGRVAALIAGGMAVLCLVGASFFLYSYARDRQIVVRITEDGVERGGILWGWANIASIRGEISSWPAGVVPFFRLRGSVALDRPLETDPPLTEAEFSTLMSRLHEFTLQRHPHVQIDEQARSASPM